MKPGPGREQVILSSFRREYVLEPAALRGWCGFLDTTSVKVCGRLVPPTAQGKNVDSCIGGMKTFLKKCEGGWGPCSSKRSHLARQAEGYSPFLPTRWWPIHDSVVAS